jgi:hypothetical protein
MTKMKSRLIALVSAAALAFGAAAPASALSDQDRSALALILGAVVVGAIINDANKKKKRDDPPVVTRYGNDGWYDNRHDDDRDRWDRKHRRAIPAQCSFQVRGNYGRRDVVSARCLSEFGMGRNLPRDCAFDVRDGREIRRVYGARCLMDNGYKIAGLR